MKHRNTVFALVAIVAEPLAVMAEGTIRFLAVGIEPVSKYIIQFMNISGQIIPPMAIYTERFLPMTLVTP